MKFKELKQQIKEEQKQRAQKIIRGKFLRKPKNRLDLSDSDKKSYCWNYTNSSVYDYCHVVSLSHDYRHVHIAYCMFFNKTPYEKIESKVREDHAPKKSLIDHYIKQWESLLSEETIRNCA